MTTFGIRPSAEAMYCEMTWPEWERNLKAYYAEPRFRPATRKLHCGVARLIAEYAERPGSIDAYAVTQLVEKLTKASKKPATINKTIRSLKAQSRIMLGLHILVQDPFALVKMTIPEDPDDYQRPRHLTLDQLAAVFNLADTEAETTSKFPLVAFAPWGGRLWRARRRRALLYLLAFCGIRRNEALNRRIEDVLFDSAGDCAIVEIRGKVKTKASRQPVPLPQPGLAVIRQWIDELQNASDTPWLFPQSRIPARPWTGGSNRYCATAELHQLGDRAGVANLTPLTLRHSWATHAEGAWGMTELQIKRVLRHTNLRTQTKYRHADLENLHAIGRRVQFRIVRPDDDTNQSPQPIAQTG